MTIKNRIEKLASGTSFVSKAINAIPEKYRMGAVGVGSVGAYVGGKQAVQDMKEGRKIRKRENMEKKYSEFMNRMQKQASVEHVGRTYGQIFPLASESGAISWRQSLLGGLIENKDKMGQMAQSQLKDMFPKSHSTGKTSYGYRQRSMMSGKDAGSSLIKSFKSK